MHIHLVNMSTVLNLGTIYEPRTLSSPHDYGVPSLSVSPDGILNFSRLAAPVAAKTKLHVVGGASGFRLLVERSHVQFHSRRRFHCGSGQS